MSLRPESFRDAVCTTLYREVFPIHFLQDTGKKNTRTDKVLIVKHPKLNYS